MKLLLLPLATIAVAASLALMTGCSGSDTDSDPNENTAELTPVKLPQSESPKSFTCKSSDGKSERTCETKNEFCLVTEVPSGAASTIQCVTYASSNCKDQACLFAHAKSLFPNVENCKHQLSYERSNDIRTVRCIHPYI